MAQDCSLQMPEDFVLPLLPSEELKDKYRRYLFRDYVEVLGVCCLCVYELNKMHTESQVERLGLSPHDNALITTSSARMKPKIKYGKIKE